MLNLLEFKILYFNVFIITFRYIQNNSTFKEPILSQQCPHPVQRCPYHGVTLSLPPYIDLVKEANAISLERKATVNLVQVNNMNPEILLKDITEKETFILMQVDSTVEGLNYLKILLEEHKNNNYIVNVLNNRKQVAVLLFKRREELALKIENYKIEHFNKIKMRNERINSLINYLRIQVELLNFEKQSYEKRNSTPRHILATTSLIREIEEAILRLEIILAPQVAETSEII